MAQSTHDRIHVDDANVWSLPSLPLIETYRHVKPHFHQACSRFIVVHPRSGSYSKTQRACSLRHACARRRADSSSSSDQPPKPGSSHDTSFFFSSKDRDRCGPRDRAAHEIISRPVTIRLDSPERAESRRMMSIEGNQFTGMVRSLESSVPATNRDRPDNP